MNLPEIACFVGGLLLVIAVVIVIVRNGKVGKSDFFMVVPGAILLGLPIAKFVEFEQGENGIRFKIERLEEKISDLQSDVSAIEGTTDSIHASLAEVSGTVSNLADFPEDADFAEIERKLLAISKRLDAVGAASNTLLARSVLEGQGDESGRRQLEALDASVIGVHPPGTSIALDPHWIAALQNASRFSEGAAKLSYGAGIPGIRFDEEGRIFVTTEGLHVEDEDIEAHAEPARSIQSVPGDTIDTSGTDDNQREN